MIQKNSDSELTLECSGGVISPYGGIIGINPELEIFEGYDGDLAVSHAKTGGSYGCKFTKEERQELADYMISLWAEYKNK